MYQVTFGHDNFEKESREEAVELAKELSEDGRPSLVVSDNERERMTFQEGSLTKYSYDPRR